MKTPAPVRLDSRSCKVLNFLRERGTATAAEVGEFLGYPPDGAQGRGEHVLAGLLHYGYVEEYDGVHIPVDKVGEEQEDETV